MPERDTQGDAGSSRCYFGSHAWGPTYIITLYSGEGDKQFRQVERWKTRTMRTKRRRNAERNEGVNRNLIQHIPSLDSCTLLNKAVDIVCYWS